jgi:hypothetical protein
LEDGLTRVSAKQDALKAEVEREVATTQSLRAEVAKMKTKLQLNEGVVAQAIQSTEAAWAETL